MNLLQIEKLYPVLKQFQEIEMPIKITYKFSKLLNFIEKDYHFFLKKMRGILDKYAEKDENGQIIVNNGTIPLLKDFQSEAEKEIQLLYEIEVEKPDIYFTLTELENINMTPNDLRVMIDFIEE